MNDFKLHPTKINKIEHRLNIVTAFCKEIGMMLYAKKRVHLQIEKDKIIKSGRFTFNNLTIQSVTSGDNYIFGN